MSPNASISLASADDAAAVSRLVQAAFQAHVAADWDEDARTAFHDETTAEKLADRLAESTYAAVWREGSDVCGVILLARPDLVQLCFVATTHLRQGIGSALWESARAHVEANFPEVRTVELNASPYALPAYRAMGFFAISKTYRRRGAVATRMACWLPDRGLVGA